MLLDRLSYRRAGRAGGISKTEAGDSLDLLLGPLGRVGVLPARRQLHHHPGDLRKILTEMAGAGALVVVDGPATRVQRPRGWANQKVLYDFKRDSHTAKAWRSPRSGVTCYGSTAAGRQAATSTS